MNRTPSHQVETTITVGRNTVPVTITFGETRIYVESGHRTDRDSRADSVVTINGVPHRFSLGLGIATEADRGRRVHEGLFWDGASIYRTDKNFGHGDATQGASALVYDGLVIDTAARLRAEHADAIALAIARQGVEHAQRAYDEARAAANEAAKVLADAVGTLAALEA